MSVPPLKLASVPMATAQLCGGYRENALASDGYQGHSI